MDNILGKRQRLNSKSISNTLSRFISVLDEGEEFDVGEMTDDPLFDAIQVVVAEDKVRLNYVATADQESKDDPVELIATANNIFVRKVKLREPDWYRKDSGPLLGGLEDGTPVAFLFRKGRYVYSRSSSDSNTVLNRANASTVSETAYQFYPQLPMESLNWLGIIKFSIGNYRSDMMAVLLMAVFTGLLSMVTPMITGYLMNETIPDANLTQLARISMGLLFIYIAVLVFNIARSVALTRIQGKVENKLQPAIWGRLINLPASFYKDYSAGEITEKAMMIDQIQQALTGPIINTLLSSFMVLFNFALLFFYSWKLAIVGAVTTLLLVLMTVGFSLYQTKLTRKILKLTSKQSSLTLQFLTGIEKLKVAGAEFRAFARLGELFVSRETLAKKNEKAADTVAVVNSGLTVLSSAAIFATLIYTGVSDELSLGEFIAFNAAYSQFLVGALAISTVFSVLVTVIPMYKEFKPILETVPEAASSNNTAVQLKGGISIDHVRFAYDKDGPLVLEDVSLEVKAGEMVALVGPSGCGKSTLFRLLLGFEEPFSGEIFYDGSSMSEVNLQSLRRQLGVVLQNSTVMSGSLYENIVGTKNLTIDDAWCAAEKAGLADDIKAMPMGMHTVVLQGGGTLSGGQRQRLIIARAMAQCPKIMYFDEATSALDNRTQEIVSKSLEQLDVTRVVIAHRLSTIINADKICVLNKGRIQQQGTYSELMEDKDGLFYELASRQQV